MLVKLAGLPQVVFTEVLEFSRDGFTGHVLELKGREREEREREGREREGTEVKGRGGKGTGGKGRGGKGRERELESFSDGDTAEQDRPEVSGAGDR